MAYLDIQLGIPMAILVASIAGTMIVRFVATAGERRARSRTLRLLDEIGVDPDTSDDKGGMQRPGRGSTP